MQTSKNFICANLKNFIFYPLHLNDQEIPKNAPLRDIIEIKLCNLLNLEKQKEYFLHYHYLNGVYYCILSPKEALKELIRESDDFLSHPCFLCKDLARDSKQYFLILDSFNVWCLVGYEDGGIFILEQLNELLELQNFLDSNTLFSLVLFGALKNSDLLYLKGFSYKEIPQNALKLDLEFNFNPLEKEIPLLKTPLGNVIKSFLLGSFCGLFAICALFILNVLLERKITTLEHLKAQQLDAILIKEKSLSNAELETINLHKKLESLQQKFYANKEILKSKGADSYAWDFVKNHKYFLENNNIKIAYFFADSKQIQLLLNGKNTLRFLEILEQDRSIFIKNFDNFYGFFWIELQKN